MRFLLSKSLVILSLLGDAIADRGLIYQPGDDKCGIEGIIFYSYPAPIAVRPGLPDVNECRYACYAVDCRTYAYGQQTCYLYKEDISSLPITRGNLGYTFYHRECGNTNLPKAPQSTTELPQSTPLPAALSTPMATPMTTPIMPSNSLRCQVKGHRSHAEKLAAVAVKSLADCLSACRANGDCLSVDYSQSSGCDLYNVAVGNEDSKSGWYMFDRDCYQSLPGDSITTGDEDLFDALIVGGPAGLAALSSLARANRKALLIDSGIYRSAAIRKMHDVVGFDGKNCRNSR